MTNQIAASDPVLSLVPFGGFGPRATPLAGEYPLATLFVGLGQVGWHAVSLISTMLNASLPSKDLAQVQYLAIARRPPVLPEGRLGRENCLLLSLEETNWSHIPGRYSAMGVARWWPKPPRDLAAMPEMNEIRAYGRLLLFDNPMLVNDTLTQRTTALVNHSARPTGDGRRLIVIVGSIAEAEGSGLLFDVAWLLRLRLLESPTQIVAMLTTDTETLADDKRTLAVANVYATLKELDALMVNPAQYPLGLPLTQGTARLQPSVNQRPLDYILLTGDAAKPEPTVVPAAALAELAATWVMTYVGGSDSPGPDLAPLTPPGKTERFDGFTTFNVSKIGLPVTTAIDLVGGSLSQDILAAMLEVRQEPSTEQWSETTLAAFKQTLVYDTFYEEPKIRDRMSELRRKATSEAISAEVRAKPQDFSMKALAESIVRRLEHEDRTVEMIDVGHTAKRLETLRTRAEDTLDQLQARLASNVSTLPTTLSCQQGNGLQWTYAALTQLSKVLNETLNKCREQSSIAEEVWQESRRQVQTMGREHDETYSGIKRRARGSISKDLQELAIAFDYVTTCAAERIRWSTEVVAWQKTWELVDRTLEEVRAGLAQIERTHQAIDSYIFNARLAMDLAAQRPAAFPAGVIVDSNWFQGGVADALQPNLSSKEVILRVYRQWAGNLPHSERRVDRFIRDVLSASRQFLLGKFQFDSLQRYILGHAASSFVQHAVVDFQKAALPQMSPARETSGWTTHEWLRAVPQLAKLLPSAAGSPWKRLNINSPDSDEMTMIRFTHNVSAEMIAMLRGPYRRAYDRIAADGVPLHIDRRWESTLADLVRNTAQAEISQLWEATLEAAAGGHIAIREPLYALVRTLAVAMGVDPTTVQRIPTPATDFSLTIYPLPTYRLRLPPAQCPIVFCFSNRRPRELGQEIYQAVSNLGLAEPFLFIVNLNGRKDMDVVVEALSNESYNVVILDEARFKRVVSSRNPLSALGEIVLTDVDLTLVSPFYTKAPVPERMFYGREREIKDVRRKIKTHSVALIGGRRIGKTSTLQQIERVLRAPDSGYQVYYLDCHNAMQYAHFFNSIARRWGIQHPSPDPTSFEDIVTVIRKRHPDQTIVFLFDEVDRLLTMDMEQQQSELLFRTFRALSNEGKAHFIFSGERWLARAMENSYSALFNFALPVRLQPLDKDVVERLVTEPFEMMNIWLEDGPSLINRIYEISAGHPNIVQMICQEIVVAMDADRANVGLMNAGHFERALDQHSLQEDIVHTIWGQMSDIARLITLLWPEDERSLSLDQIQGKIRAIGLPNFQIRDLQEAMKDLELYCFVTPKGREYELVPVAFPALLDYMTVKQMEITATIESIQTKAKKELFSR
ncbi:MAG: tubulin-like doman-containing protein [Chloroflexota bacterium]